MTTNRRQAEQRILREAKTFVRGLPTGDERVWAYIRSPDMALMHDRLEPLIRAVEDFDELTPGPADHAPTGVRDTSIDAADSLRSVGGLAMEVFDTIVVGGGLTVDQVEVKLARPHQTVSARVNGLLNAGWVEDSGMRRKTRSGRKAIVWKPTPAALKRLDEQETT